LYHFAVLAVQEDGEPFVTEDGTFTTQAADPPRVPGLVAEALEDGVRLTWGAPVTSGAPVEGFLVWRSQSPFVVVEHLADPSARSYVDRGADFTRDATYIVTYYTSDGVFSADNLPGSLELDTAGAQRVPGGSVGGGDASAGFSWAYFGFALVLLLLVAAVVALGVVLTRRRAADPAHPPRQPRG
jgi:hypothetical protein